MTIDSDSETEVKIVDKKDKKSQKQGKKQNQQNIPTADEEDIVLNKEF